VIRVWKAERFDPDKLVKFYKDNGAKIFMALANHHDNFDLYNSKYQPWNSVALGPKKDLIGGWAKAARKHGLRFGVSVHASHTWMWYEPAQGADKEGPFAGVPYDGKLTKADGKASGGTDSIRRSFTRRTTCRESDWSGNGIHQRQQRSRRGLHGEILQTHAPALGRLPAGPDLFRRHRAAVHGVTDEVGLEISPRISTTRASTGTAAPKP
jgi:hypothetical protein